MLIEIWSLGKGNEAFFDDAIRHYLKKVKPYQQVDLHLLALPNKLATSDPTRLKQLEEELLLKRLQPHHYLILLDERGKQHSSTEWAKQLQQLMNLGTKTIVILIGGAFGVSDAIKQRAQQTWSLSNLVFPHQLVRLMVAEQLYRAYSILNNSPYHHE